MTDQKLSAMGRSQIPLFLVGKYSVAEHWKSDISTDQNDRDKVETGRIQG
jgi:hypothetical protein